jgi:hypothetical protein
MDTAARQAANGMAVGEHELTQVSESLRLLRVVWGDGYEFGHDEQGYWAERLDHPGTGETVCWHPQGTWGTACWRLSSQSRRDRPYLVGRKRTSTSRRRKPNSPGRMGSRP